MSTGKIISAPAAAVALLCFFLPWFSVSCDAGIAQSKLELSGFDLASKGAVGVMAEDLESGMAGLEAFMGDDLLGDFMPDELAGAGSAADLAAVDTSDPILYVIPLAAGLALILVLAAYRHWMTDKTSAIIVLLLALAGLGVLFFLWWGNRDAFAAFPALDLGFVSFNIEYGFWGTILGLGALLIGAIVSLNEAQDSSQVMTDYTLNQPTSANIGQLEILPPMRAQSEEPTREQADSGPTTFVPEPGIGSVGYDEFGGQAPAKTEILQREQGAMAWFVVREGGRSGQQFRVSEVTSIGRDATNDIVLDDTALSGSHARVRLEDDTFYIYDLASTNGVEMYMPDSGTWEKIYRQELGDGDNIKIGRTVLHFMTLSDLDEEKPDA